MATISPDFDAVDLAAVVEQLPPAALHTLSFGPIRLDPAGRVVFYSDAERRLSGYPENPVGRTFFTEIAPCMDNPEFRGRIDRALETGRLNISFRYVGDFGHAQR